MNRPLRSGLIALALILALMPGTTLAAAPSYTCTGGVIPPGTYNNLIVSGFCSIPSGTVVVLNGLTVMSGGALDATSTAAHVAVKGGVKVGRDALFAFGCSPSLCEDTTADTISGGIVADRPLGVILHGNTINGNVKVTGGGGPFNCDFEQNPALLPNYTTFENNRINGTVTVTGLKSCWFGFIRNDLRGGLTFMNNQMADPDANEIVSNTIRGNLACSNNSPAPQVGDSQGATNKVTGKKLGQCAGL